MKIRVDGFNNLSQQADIKFFFVKYMGFNKKRLPKNIFFS